jgi:hypothetical protein
VRDEKNQNGKNVLFYGSYAKHFTEIGAAFGARH